MVAQEELQPLTPRHPIETHGKDPAPKGCVVGQKRLLVQNCGPLLSYEYP